MKIIASLVIISLGIGTIGCTATNKLYKEIADYETLFVDEAFPAYKRFKIESEQEIFALDESMKALVSKSFHNTSEYRLKTKKFVKYLFSREYIDLSYQADANLTAAQAFHSKSTNCLSLTIMAYSLAKYAGFDTKFKSVNVPEYWIRNGNYNTLAGHVNLEIKEKSQPNVPIVIDKRATVIDFDPSISSQSFDSFEINKTRVLAMFYNNKGAIALANGQYDLAYSYFRTAVKTDPTFSSTWGNLGVLYRVKNMFSEAKSAYQYAVFLNEENYTAYRNLALTLNLMGEREHGQNIIETIHRKRMKNPYYLVMLGDEALYKSDYKEAIINYKKAMQLDQKIHEIYFGLAKAYYATGNTKKAEKSIERAIRYNNLDSVDNQYMAKLNFIRGRH